MISRTVRVPAGGAVLTGDLAVPRGAGAMVLFAHGSGSSRHSPRNRMVAGRLRDGGLGTLLIDLLTGDEDRRDRATAEHRFDIGLLGRRLAGALDWLRAEPVTRGLPVALFGASTGAAAALVAAAEQAGARADRRLPGRPSRSGG
jgi:dienelactone hydrolase